MFPIGLAFSNVEVGQFPVRHWGCASSDELTLVEPALSPFLFLSLFFVSVASLGRVGRKRWESNEDGTV